MPSCLLLFLAGAAFADDVHSNGTGGGAWSDPATWRARKVPGPADAAIVSRGDTVAFDGKDEDKASCASLLVDPRGTLTFKAGAGKVTLTVAGPIESYGTINLDATGTLPGSRANDEIELRLAGDTEANRTLKLQQGALLLVHGRSGDRTADRNVTISARPLPPPPAPPAPPVPAGAAPAAPATPPPPPSLGPTAQIQAGMTNTIDFRRANLVNVALLATSIDNTGAKANERLNVVECRFSNGGRLVYNSCDTGLIADNDFIHEGEAQSAYAPINIVSSPLSDVRGNTVTGRWLYGLLAQSQNDSTITGNTFEKCVLGVYWHGANGMFQNNTFRGCDTGMLFTSASAAVENTAIDGSQVAVNVGGAEVQFTGLAVTNLRKDGVAMDLGGGAVVLVNSTLKPTDIKLGKTPPKDKPWVDAFHYLVVKVAGTPPAGAEVEAKTVGWSPPAPGAADLNVRSSPAKIGRGGFTPLPGGVNLSDMPLLVRAWTIPAGGAPTPAPSYAVSVIGPAPSKGAARPALKAVTLQPAETWFRAKPNEPKPTPGAEMSVP